MIAIVIILLSWCSIVLAVWGTLRILLILQRAQSVHGVTATVRLPPIDPHGKPKRLGGEFFDRIAPLIGSGGVLRIVGFPQQPVSLRICVQSKVVLARVRSIVEGMLHGCQVTVIDRPPEETLPDHGWIGMVELVARYRNERFQTTHDVADAIDPILSVHLPGSGIHRIVTDFVLVPAFGTWQARMRKTVAARSQMRGQRRSKVDGILANATMYRVGIRIEVVGDDRTTVEQEIERVASVIDGVMRREAYHRRQSFRRLRGWSAPVSHLTPDARGRTAWQRAVGVGMLIGGGIGLLATWITDSVLMVDRSIVARLAVIGAQEIAWVLAIGIWVGTRHPWMGIVRVRARAPTDAYTMLSGIELANLWNTPTTPIPVDRLPNCYLPPPERAFASAQRRSRAPWIALGWGQRYDGRREAIGTTLRDLRQVLHITAGMGAGKSRLLANIIAQIARGTNGMGIIDGKGDDSGSLAWLALDLIPMEREKDIVFIYPLEAERPVCINPMLPSDADPTGIETVNHLLALCSRLDPEGWHRSHGMEQYAMHAGILVSEGEPSPTLFHVKAALTSEPYRNRLLKSVRNPETHYFWTKMYPEHGKAQKTSIDALIRRIDKILTIETIRRLFVGSSATVRMKDIIEGNRILIVPLPGERLGGIAYAFGTLLVREIVLGAFQRGGSDVDREEWPLIIDEVQVLLDQTGGNDDFRTMISRMRSLGIPGIYAHQALAQLGDLAPEMLVNAANRVVLRTPPPDADVYARRYAGSGIVASDIANQEPGLHQYFDLMVDGHATRLFSGQPLDWPESPLPTLSRRTDIGWRDRYAPEPQSAEGRHVDAIARRLMEIGTIDQEITRWCHHLAETLDATTWRHVGERITLHCETQRETLLQHPEIEPNHRLRRMIISSLRYGRPIGYALVDYLRLRRLITEVHHPLPFAPSSSGLNPRARTPRRSVATQENGDGAPAAQMLETGS